MPSSTSSSERRLGRPLALFAATFAALTAVGAWTVRHVPALAFAARPAPVVSFPDASWYLAFDGGTNLDHYVLLNDVGPSIAHARAADVLLLGNSRTQFAFPSRVLRDFEARDGVTFFNLAFGFVEGSALPLRLIRAFDLRPKLAIVNTDAFFHEIESPIAKQVQTQGRWGATKALFEASADATVAPLRTRVFPSFAVPQSGAYLLRSSTHGSWLPVGWPHDDRPLVAMRDRTDVEQMLPVARRFANELDRRGTTMVLTCIPGPTVWCSPERTAELAARLGVAVLQAPVAGLMVGDGSHLGPMSATRHARAFLRALEQLDAFRRIARHPVARR